MAIDKAVDSTELESDLETVAGAIRAASGTNATLSFPAGMVSALDGLLVVGANVPIYNGEVC